MAAKAPLDPSKFVPQNGEIPVIAYTEQILAEKEATLRKYIENNYTKIQNVEKELANLALEVKLTSGSKKAALEHLRKKIEQASERIKAAKEKEEASKKVWEAAAKVVAEEEAIKKGLCDDLNLMVQESAMAQYEKLEELTRKLDALNPDLAGGAIEALEGLRAKIAPHGVPILNAPQDSPESAPPSANGSAPPATGAPPADGTSASGNAAPGKAGEPGAGGSLIDLTSQGTVSTIRTKYEGRAGSPSNPTPSAAPEEATAGRPRSASAPAPAAGQRGGRGRGRGRGRGSLVKGNTSAAAAAGGGSESAWTGAGFDVEEGGDY